MRKRFWFFLIVVLNVSILAVFLIVKDVEGRRELAQKVSEVKISVPEVSSLASPTASPSASEESNVVRVIDGDTIEIEGKKTVRYIGIDTPEIHHPTKPVGCFGAEAAKRNAELVLGKKVKLVKDVSETDRYGRLLRYVWVDDQFVNELLVKEGFALSATFPPDVNNQKIFQDAEREAKEKSVGLWKSCPI